jgi:hypothetical protein
MTQRIINFRNLSYLLYHARTFIRTNSTHTVVSIETLDFASTLSFTFSSPESDVFFVHEVISVPLSLHIPINEYFADLLPKSDAPLFCATFKRPGLDFPTPEELLQYLQSDEIIPNPTTIRLSCTDGTAF